MTDMGRPGAWPKINRRVEVRHEAWSGWLPSRVEDVDGRHVVIAAPSAVGLERLDAEAGDPVTLRWNEDRGLGYLEAWLVALHDGRFLRWHLNAYGEPQLVQRRHFVRAAVMLPVVAEADGDMWPLTTIDLAEGGMRCVGGSDTAWRRAREVELRFDVDGTQLRTGARVAWSGRTLAGHTVAFRFTDLTARHADELRRFVFRTQSRRARTA